MEKIEVCVRVRPLNRRELDRGETPAIGTRRSPDTLGGQEVAVGRPKLEGRERTGDAAPKSALRFCFGRQA